MSDRWAHYEWTSPCDRLRARLKFRRLRGGFMLGKHMFWFAKWRMSLNEGYFPNITIDARMSGVSGSPFIYSALWNGFRFRVGGGACFKWLGYGSSYYRPLTRI